MLTSKKVRYGCLLVITALFISFLSWFLYLANAGVDHIVFAVMRQIPYGDKLSHIGVYGILALLLNLSLRGKKIHFYQASFYLGSLLTLILVGIEETSQQFLPTRSQDWLDYVASCIGVLLTATITPFTIRTLGLKH